MALHTENHVTLRKRPTDLHAPTRDSERVPAAAAGMSTPVAGGAGTDPGPPELTGLAASVLTRPSAVRGTDGRLHIAYELVLTGATPFAVDVEQVEVRDAKTHRVLLSLAGDALSSRMNPVGGEPAGSRHPLQR
jgi:hypothetical protein